MVTTEYSFDDISSSHLWFLRFTGLVPFAGKTLNHSGTKTLLCYFVMTTLLENVMWTGYGVRMIGRKRFEVDFLCEWVVVQSICLRYLILTRSRGRLVRVVDKCRQLWTYVVGGESRVVRGFERKAFFFRTFMTINGLTVTTSFIVTSCFVRVPGPTVNDTERRILPFRFFVEVHREPMFTLASVVQCLVVYSVTILIASIETVGLYLIMMACGYLRLVRNKLEGIRNEIRSSRAEKVAGEDFDEEVLRCARFHQRIMLFCQEIESITCQIFFLSVFTSIYNVSIAGISILESDDNTVTYITLLVLNLFQFFTVQWAPEYLLMESEAIGKAAYLASTRQSSYTAKNSKALLMMMMRAQRPFQLTAGGYVNLSIETFGSMVKSAFSFFAMIRSFKS